VTELEYRQHPAVSRSELWKLTESPEKFLWYREHPQEPTPALLFGQTVHKLLLQPEGFGDEFSVAPEIDRRTKEGKAAWNAFLEASADRTVVSAADYERALAMAEKCRSEPLAAKLLDGSHETPFFWTDELTGEECKCRTDVLTEIGDNLVIVDYKTCTDAGTDAFLRDAIRYGYHFQAALYCEGVEKNTGRRPLFVFIAQEKTEPYAVNILQADKLLIENGYDVFRELLGIYHYCKTSGNWYGFLGRENIINNLSLPAWMMKGD
jgi:exodeoxyribonuclease VIII